nr:hypothetical protein [Tanacetum cinerariifolium]
EIRAEKIARIANPLALIAQQQPVYYPQHPPTQFTQISSTRSQQAATRNRGKAIVNSPQPIYDQEPLMVDEDDETSKDKEIDKLMALISLSHVAGECQKPKRAKDAAYHREKMLLCKQKEAGIQLNAEQADWRDDTDDDKLEDQELEAHYLYMAQLQQVSPDAADSGPIFDDEPLQKKPKRAKDAAYHREKMLLCKQEEAGIQLNAEQADWKDDTDDESDDQELEAHYMYMAKIQEASPDAVDSGPIFDTEP